MKLFSVTVNRRVHATFPLIITIENHNMPNIPTESFIMGRRQAADDSFSNIRFSASIIFLGESIDHYFGGGATIWLGTPAPEANGFTPFVRFNIRLQ